MDTVNEAITFDPAAPIVAAGPIARSVRTVTTMTVTVIAAGVEAASAIAIEIVATVNMSADILPSRYNPSQIVIIINAVQHKSVARDLQW